MSMKISTRCDVAHKRTGFQIKFDKLTKGEVLSLINALRIARTVSTVAQDLSGYLEVGFYDMRSDIGTEFMNELKSDINLTVVKADE